MADSMETPSLAAMVSARGGVNREVSESRFKTTKSGNSSQASAQAQRGGFDGFLNTFLGKDKAGAASSSRPGKAKTSNKTSSLSEHISNTEKSSRKSGSGKSGKADRVGGKMAAEDRQALRDSMDKTVADDEANAEGGHGEYPPDVVAAAEEAAALIWNLLYGPAEELPADLMNFEGQGGEALKAISNLINNGIPGTALAGMGTDGAVDLSALQGAIETANASAEMNSAAVLSALDDLLDGMPRSALEDALARTADAMGLPSADEGDVFNRIAAALDAEVVDVGGGEAELLSFLGGAAVHAGAGEEAAAALELDNASEAAEISGTSLANEVDAEELAKLFAEFLEENPDAGLTSEPGAASAAKGEQVFANFSEWLQDSGKVKEAKQLVAEPNKFVAALVRSASEGMATSAETGEKISWTMANLEMFLQNTSGMKENATAEILEEAEAILPFGKTAVQTEQGAQHAVGGVQQQVHLTPAAAQHGTANPTTMSTMLDQIENIERLAEAMKLSARNGVKDLTMQLSPAELGKVMLRVESVNGAINAYLRVEKPEAAAQLGGVLDQLRETLKGQGIELGELSLRQQGSNEALGDFSQQRQDGREANESRERGRGRGGRHDSNETEADAPPAVSSGNAGPGALNLIA